MQILTEALRRIVHWGLDYLLRLCGEWCAEVKVITQTLRIMVCWGVGTEDIWRMVYWDEDTY